MMQRVHLLAIASLSLFHAASAGAAPNSAYASQDYFVPYVGDYRLWAKQSSVQFGAEYRFHQWDYGVRPTLGANVDGNGDTYAYGGVNVEVPVLNDRLLLVPSFMVGYYHHNSGKDLGGPLEFRTGFEVDYQLENSHRIGVAFNHISNAHIYHDNPGAQTVLVNYSIPVGSLFNY